MTRLFGCICNEPQRLACALYPSRHMLTAETAPVGWGVGFLQGGEALLKRHPKPTGAIDFYAQLKDLKTDYLIGQVREQGVEGKLDNTPPFRFRSWMFAFSGRIERFEAVQAAVLEQVPDFLRRNIRGETPAEHLFHLLLAFLHDNGKIDDPNVRASDVASALRTTVGVLDQLTESARVARVDLAIATTNGRVMLAVRRGKKMLSRRVDGVTDCAVCRDGRSELTRDERRRTMHEHLKAVVVVSDPPAVDAEGWTEIPDDSVLAISRDLQTQIIPIDHPRPL